MNRLTSGAHPDVQRLQALAALEQQGHLAAAFAADPARFTAFSRQHDGVLYDFSKNRMSREVLSALLRWALSREVPARLQELFSGAPLNASEGRPALHTWLRGAPDPTHPVAQQMAAELERQLAFVDAVRAKADAGQISDVINLGIGGSLLGPHMVTRALKRYAHPGLKFHFISDPDGVQLADRLQTLDPARTLVLVISKSFTTQETLRNAERAKAWLCGALGEAQAAQHFIGVSAKPERMSAFGIAEAQQFPMWESVGGRFSVWSAVGLAPALALGRDGFCEFLRGAHNMDTHVRTAAAEHNLAILYALSHVWHHSFLDIPNVVQLPYHPRLRLLPPFLQQLEMESLGKRVDVDHRELDLPTGAFVFGQTGVNAQHSFMQLMHQGPADFLADFVAIARDAETADDLALASCLAQSRALMQGTVEPGIESWRICPGNRPSNTLVLDTLSPFSMGQLLALYEHKVFVQSVLWNINPFDQWGVELGKTLALDVHAQLRAGTALGLDASTAGLLAHVRAQRET